MSAGPVSARVNDQATGLVIFDCDGVLVDSELISAQVLMEALSGEGLAVDEKFVFERFLGRSMASAQDVLLEQFSYHMEDRLKDEISARVRQRMAGELEAVPGVSAALAAIKSPKCVASSSAPERLRFSLGKTRLLKFFGKRIFSATMVAKGKPAPDLFLYAAKKMRTAPDQCVVIEDSPAGVEAAKRAEMRVFAFTGGAHIARSGLKSALAALDPDAIFDNMSELPGLLAQGR